MSGARSDIEVPESTLLPETQVEPAAPEADRPLSPREEMMAKIAAKRERQIEAEVGQWASQPVQEQSREHHSETRIPNPGLGETEEDRVYSGPYAEPEPEAETEAPAVERPARAAVPAPVQQPAQPSQPQTFPIDIDGQQVYVTQDQMAHLARMGAIANQALYAYNQNPQNNPPAPAAAQPAPASNREQGHVVSEDRIRETARAIQYGDEQAAATALKDLISDVSRNQAPSVDLDAHRRTILADVRREQQLHADTSVIRTEYADVLGNPILADAAARQVQAIRQQVVALGIQASDLDIYREAGNRVRQAFGTAPPQSGNQGQAPAPAGQTAPQAPSNMVVRRSVADIDGRKRAAPQRTATVIDRRSAAPEAPRPPTGSDVVEQMRKSRHQSPMR